MTKTTQAGKSASAAAPGAAATNKPPESDAADAAGATTSARILAAVTIGGVRYRPDGILEGLPAGVAGAHADALDPHPDAVSYARSIDAPVHQYQPDPAAQAAENDSQGE